MRNFLNKALESRCALLEVAGSAEEAEALRLRFHFDLLLVDIRLPGLSGLEWIERLRERGVRTHVIYMTAYADLEMAIVALRNEADDFIMKPFRTEQMFLSMRRTLMRRQILRENSLLRLQLEQMQDQDGIVGESDTMVAMLSLAQRAAPGQSAVLIQGESGSGKSMLARTIHTMSRRSGAFVTLHCGTLQDAQIESELFGLLKGSDPEAENSRDGLIVHADKGTLFLDELGCLPETVQLKLLSFLEEGVVRAVGSTEDIPVDVRLISATSSIPDTLIDSGSFRRDLFYRLNVMPIKVPALRERGRDVQLLFNFFMERLSAELRLDAIELLHCDREKLNHYQWPGNVRELRNLVERTLMLGELPADSLQSVAEEVWNDPGYPLDWTMDAVERAHIEAVLASVSNNKSAAARLLGVSRKTLERKQALWQSVSVE